MSLTYEGDFYCVKCRAKRRAIGDIEVNERGTRLARARCPECGTSTTRILGRG